MGPATPPDDAPNFDDRSVQTVSVAYEQIATDTYRLDNTEYVHHETVDAETFFDDLFEWTELACDTAGLDLTVVVRETSSQIEIETDNPNEPCLVREIRETPGVKQVAHYPVDGPETMLYVLDLGREIHWHLLSHESPIPDPAVS